MNYEDYGNKPKIKEKLEMKHKLKDNDIYNFLIEHYKRRISQSIVHEIKYGFRFDESINCSIKPSSIRKPNYCECDLRKLYKEVKYYCTLIK
jgi:hypothetical protein